MIYLEVSNIAAVCGVNPYESREKILLINWARHCPDIVKKYLIDNNCISEVQTQSNLELQKNIYDQEKPDNFDIKDFEEIKHKTIKKYRTERGNNETEEEIKEFSKEIDDNLKKDLGNVKENKVIIENNYSKGNEKMYYYNITNNFKIGGKYDAIIDDKIIEIKTRTAKRNVKKNLYDLYQLISYLIVCNKEKGKIVQYYNSIKYDSDIETDFEFGLININDPKIYEIVNNIKNKLYLYFIEIDNLIKTGIYIYLNKIIPPKIRPIITINNDNICRYDIKFKNLVKLLNN